MICWYVPVRGEVRLPRGGQVGGRADRPLNAHHVHLRLLNHLRPGLQLFLNKEERRLKEESRPLVSNVTSADVRLATGMGRATSLVNVMKSI